MSADEEADDGPEMVESASGRRRTGVELKEADIPDLTNAEKRSRIAMIVGFNKRHPRTPFGKRRLNSIYAYMTGSWHFPKKHLGTPQSPSIGHIREAVMDQVGYDEYEFGENGQKGVDDADAARPFNSDELESTLIRLDGSSDERPTPDDPQ